MGFFFSVLNNAAISNKLQTPTNKQKIRTEKMKRLLLFHLLPSFNNSPWLFFVMPEESFHWNKQYIWPFIAYFPFLISLDGLGHCW